MGGEFSGHMSIFVKLKVPFDNRSTITLTVQPLDKIAAVKKQIEKRTRYLVARQSLFLVSGKRLDDHETLAACHISKDSTLHLKVRSDKRVYDSETPAAYNYRNERFGDSVTLASRAYSNSNDSTQRVKVKKEPPRGPAWNIKIQVLPINRFISLRIRVTATIRDLKDLVFKERGIVCEDFYLDDVTGEKLGDNVTLTACSVPERTLVAVTRHVTRNRFRIEQMLRKFWSALNGRFKVSRGRDSGSVDVAFKEAFDTNRTAPDLEHMESEEVRKEVWREVRREEQNNQQGQVSEIETGIATTLQTHQDCERKLTLMLDEKNRLQTDLLELQTKYPKLLSGVREERNRLQQDLNELQNEFPRQLSCILDEKDKLQQQLTDVQSEFHQQVTLALDENSTLEKELETLKIDLGHEKEKRLCTICFDKPRDTLVFSCLHLHFCSSCLQQHQQRTNTCPTCRGFISGKLVCAVT